MHELIINNKDVGKEYGVFLAEGSYDDILVFPTMRSPQSIQWGEKDNDIEVDLTSPSLEAPTFTLSLIIRDGSKIDDFLTFLMSAVYLTYTFPDLGVSKKYRWLQSSVLYKVKAGQWNRIEVKLIDDTSYTFTDNTYVKPTFPQGFLLSPDCGVTIDNHPIRDMNISPLEGFIEELQQPHPTFERFIIESKFRTGQLYGTNNNLPQPPLVRQGKTASLPFHIHLPTQQVYKVWWNTLLKLLSSPGEHVLKYNSIQYHFYYKEMKVEQVEVRDTSIIIIFTIDIYLL